MTSTYEKHLDAIQSGSVSKTNVIGLRKAFNADLRRSNGWSVPKSAMPADQVWNLYEAVEKVAPIVAGDLHDSGLSVLRNKRYRKRLADVQPIIDTLQRFRLCGWEFIGQRGQYAVPVYKAEGKAGSFRFINIPWQAGGKGPDIL